MENTTLRQRINVNGRDETQNDADNLYKITVEVLVHFVTSTVLGLTDNLKPMTRQKLSQPCEYVLHSILSLPLSFDGTKVFKNFSDSNSRISNCSRE